MAKTSGRNRGGRNRGLVGGGRVRVGNIRVDDIVLPLGYYLERGGGGFLVTKINRVTVGVSTGGSSGKISRRDLVGGYVFRGKKYMRIGG